MCHHREEYASPKSLKCLQSTFERDLGLLGEFFKGDPVGGGLQL
jgi:hypothetical protein